jgi:hypothetical protein
MHALFNRLRVGGAPQAWVSDPETAADLLQQADEALEAAQIRIAQLTEALQGLVDLSDAMRPRNMAEVRRRLVYAQRLLSGADDVAPFGWLDAVPSTSAPATPPARVESPATVARPAPVAPPAAVAPPAPMASAAPIAPATPIVPATLSKPATLSAPAAPPPFFLRVDQPDGRDTEEEDLERDLDNLKKILEASWS